MTKLLCFNFGSTSTKMAAFEDDQVLFIKGYNAGTDEYPRFNTLDDHQAFAEQLAINNLAEVGLTLEDIDVFVARGGAQSSIESGAYDINDVMFEDTFKYGGEVHPGKLGTRICYKLGNEYSKPKFIVNGPSSDELIEEARFTGLKGIYRDSDIHALNQKEVCYRYAAQVGRKYEDMNLIVCHVGGGISITAHRKGKMIDSNNIIKGEGPMTPTRAGALPTLTLVELCFCGKYTAEEIIGRLIKKGGLYDHLGTDDAREVEKMIADGDEYAAKVYAAMQYQIAKAAGEMAVALDGEVDQILVTGGMSKGKTVPAYIEKKLAWIAPTTVIAGEFEMEALAAGAMRVINGEQDSKVYTGIPVWTPPVEDAREGTYSK